MDTLVYDWENRKLYIFINQYDRSYVVFTLNAIKAIFESDRLTPGGYCFVRGGSAPPATENGTPFIYLEQNCIPFLYLKDKPKQ